MIEIPPGQGSQVLPRYLSPLTIPCVFLVKVPACLEGPVVMEGVGGTLERQVLQLFFHFEALLLISFLSALLGL